MMIHVNASTMMSPVSQLVLSSHQLITNLQLLDELLLLVFRCRRRRRPVRFPLLLPLLLVPLCARQKREKKKKESKPSNASCIRRPE